MFGVLRRRRTEREEFLMIHSKIAAIHGDLLRRDEDLISALSSLTNATNHVGDRLDTEHTLVTVLQQFLTAREQPAIDLTRERVLGGSVGMDADRPQPLI